MPEAVFNLIIAGIGGQGINSLAKVIAAYVTSSGLQCQFTVHKGGAQTLGSVFAEFRIHQIHQGELPVLGQGIPTGQLDGLVSLDPWEALRHSKLAHKKTLIWVESDDMPLFQERRSAHRRPTPQQQLQALPLMIHWRCYRQRAEKQTGQVTMANYFAGLDVIKTIDANFKQADHPPNQALFDKLFAHIIPKSQKNETS